MKRKLQSPKKNVEPEIAALHDGAVDHLGVFVAHSRDGDQVFQAMVITDSSDRDHDPLERSVFVEPSLVLLRTSRIDHDVARAADPPFG